MRGSSRPCIARSATASNPGLPPSRVEAQKPGADLTKINMRIDHYIHVDLEHADRIEKKLDRALELLMGIKALEQQMAHTLDEVLSDVTDESTVVDSLVTLVQGLHDQVTAAKGDQVKIDAIFAAAEANKAKLAAALVANTDAAPSA